MTPDPCGGHACDQCSRCRRGRCCRRDQPGYRLPELGEVTPIFGELGALVVDDDERVQCHACSRFFRTLNSHIQRVHELTPEEYRAAFGLNRGTALAAPAYRSHMREHGRRVLAPYWPLAADFARSQTPEQRTAQRGLRRRLQTLRDPRLKEVQRRGVQASAARNHALFVAGLWTPPRPRDPSAAGRAAQRRRQDLAQDPAYRAWLSRRLSDGQGGRVPVACATCATIFELPRARARPGARRYCSRDCLRAAQVERGRALGRATPTLMRRMDRICRVCERTFTGTVRQVYCSTACKSLADHRGASGTCAVCGRPFAGEDGQQYCSRRCAIRARSVERPGARGLGYTAIAARLRALSHEAFAELGETERQVLRLYYGLDGAGRATQASIRELLGIEQERMRRLLVTGVARLLGPDTVGATARVCTACGTSFTPLDPWSNQRTCSSACRLERRRQNGRATSPAVREDIRVQLSAAARQRRRPEREVLRALAPEAFGALPEQERQLVRLYYGLDKDELPSIAEVGQQVGLTEAQVRRRLVRAVPQLLGQPSGRLRAVATSRAAPLDSGAGVSEAHA